MLRARETLPTSWRRRMRKKMEKESRKKRQTFSVNGLLPQSPNSSQISPLLPCALLIHAGPFYYPGQMRGSRQDERFQNEKKKFSLKGWWGRKKAGVEVCPLVALRSRMLLSGEAAAEGFSTTDSSPTCQLLLSAPPLLSLLLSAAAAAVASLPVAANCKSASLTVTLFFNALK